MEIYKLIINLEPTYNIVLAVATASRPHGGTKSNNYWFYGDRKKIS